MENHKEELVQKGFKTLQKEFLIIGKTHVKSWQAWLLIGIAAGITAGIVFVANRSGEFDVSKAEQLSAPTVLILIDEKVVNGLNNELNIYIEDISRELGYKGLIRQVKPGESVEQLKSVVKRVFRGGSLVGVLIIGDVPTAQWYHPDLNEGSPFYQEGYLLSDFIYQDYYDACPYDPKRKAYSYKKAECQNAIYLSPYWVGRLSPGPSSKLSTLSTASSVKLLKDYFHRNHEYRTAQFKYKPRALSYLPLLLDYDEQTREMEREEVRNNLTRWGAYSSGNYFEVDFNRTDSDKQYYKQISNPSGYEYILFNGHGAPTFHQKNVTSQNLPSQMNFFYADFRSCSVGRFTTPEYIAGDYLFSGGLIVEAPSVPVFASSRPQSDFIYLLSAGLSFGKASGIYPQGASNILGDPTLRIMRPTAIPPTGTAVPSIEVSIAALRFSAKAPTGELTIRNKGSARLKFVTIPKYYNQPGVSKLGGFILEYALPADGLLPGSEVTVPIDTREFIPYDELKRLSRYRGELFIISDDPTQPLITIPFVIGGDGPAVSSLTVTSPNGREVWQKGSKQIIKWSGPSSIRTVVITLSTWSPPCEKLQTCPLYHVSLYNIADKTENDGYFEWVVGTDQTGKTIPNGQYVVNIGDVIGITSSSAASDSSDAPFSIITGATGTTP